MEEPLVEGSGESGSFRNRYTKVNSWKGEEGLLVEQRASSSQKGAHDGKEAAEEEASKRAGP